MSSEAPRPGRVVLHLVLLPLLVWAAEAPAAPVQRVRSPDGRIEVRVDLGDRIRYGVFVKEQPLLQVKVDGEEVALNFAGDYAVYYPKEESFFSHNEREFVRLPLKDVTSSSLASLPAVVDARDGIKVVVAESDVDDYPGLWLLGRGADGLVGTFPPYPLQEELTRDRDFKVTRGADYIAVTKGARTFPWRVLGIAEKDGDLLTNALVYLLAKPSEVADTSWIRPGKVAWDWWNANNVHGVAFKSGVNTETYKYTGSAARPRSGRC